MRTRVLALVSLALLRAGVLSTQQPALPQPVEVRHDETMFTLWAWITVADTAAPRDRWPEVKRFAHERLTARLPAPYLDTLRQVHRRHAARRFDYDATILALLLAPGPLRYSPEMIAGYRQRGGGEAYLAGLQKIGDDLMPLLQEFHRRADVPGLMAECDRWYRPALATYRDSTLYWIDRSLAYLRGDERLLAEVGRIVIVPNLIGPPGTAMSVPIGAALYDVESPAASGASFTPHEYLHSLVADLTKGERHRGQIEQVVAGVWERAKALRAGQYYPNSLSYFDESLVRTLDFTVRLGPELAYDNERLKAALGKQYEMGFLLVRPMRDALVGYEAAKQPFAEYFPVFLARLAAAAPAYALTPPPAPAARPR